MLVCLALVPAAAPRGARAGPSPGDEHWDDQFSAPSVQMRGDGVVAVAVRGSEIFVGGRFDVFNRAPANNIARWDGTRWTTLGEGPANGVDGPVSSIRVDGDDVYVGGEFRHAGGREARFVARWDGSAWHSLGEGPANGVDGNAAHVNAIVTTGDGVFVGGAFRTAGGRRASAVARWDKATGEWSSLRGGTDLLRDYGGSVSRMAADGDAVYISGNFKGVAGLKARDLARWDDRKQRWSALPGIDPAGGLDMVASGGMLYAAGALRVNGRLRRTVARWNGRSWKLLARGLPQRDDVVVGFSGVAVRDGRVVASGFFPKRVGDEDVFYPLMVWDGERWEYDGTPLRGWYFSGAYAGARVADDGVTVIGAFIRDERGPLYHVARWEPDRGAWRAFQDPAPQNGLYAWTSFATAVSGEDLYVGGDYLAAGRRVDGLARWDGETWETLAPGPDDGYLTALTVDGDDVYAGGAFSRIGGVPALFVAKWDGREWRALGGGVGGSNHEEVYAIAVDGDTVYVAGSLATAGGAPASNIAKWDGERWSTLGPPGAEGLTADEFHVATVYALEIVGGSLYAAGTFSRAGDVAANNVARWDGKRWWPLGDGPSNGVDSIVWDLASDGDVLYVSGLFATAGGTPASGIARWRDGAWSSLAGGVSLAPCESGECPQAYVFGLGIVDGSLIASGTFDRAGGAPAYGVAIWDGTQWSPLGSGVAGNAKAIWRSRFGLELAGAGLTRAGGRPSVGFARWRGPLPGF